MSHLGQQCCDCCARLGIPYLVFRPYVVYFVSFFSVQEEEKGTLVLLAQEYSYESFFFFLMKEKHKQL